MSGQLIMQGAPAKQVEVEVSTGTKVEEKSNTKAKVRPIITSFLTLTLTLTWCFTLFLFLTSTCISFTHALVLNMPITETNTATTRGPRTRPSRPKTWIPPKTLKKTSTRGMLTLPLMMIGLKTLSTMLMAKIPIAARMMA
jgi:hypothetical protein